MRLKGREPVRSGRAQRAHFSFAREARTGMSNIQQHQTTTTTEADDFDRALIQSLQENLIDEQTAIDDARADLDRAIDALRGAVARRNQTWREIAALVLKAA